MKKIQQQMVKLKAGVPYSIPVTGGIDCYSEVRFRVPHSAVGKSITFFFKDADGRQIDLPIQFSNVENVLIYSKDMENISDHNFGFVELLSKEDLHLEIWSPE